MRVSKVEIDTTTHVLKDGGFEKSFPEGLADSLGTGKVFGLEEEVLGAESGVHRLKK